MLPEPTAVDTDSVDVFAPVFTLCRELVRAAAGLVVCNASIEDVSVGVLVSEDVVTPLVLVDTVPTELFDVDDGVDDVLEEDEPVPALKLFWIADKVAETELATLDGVEVVVVVVVVDFVIPLLPPELTLFMALLSAVVVLSVVVVVLVELPLVVLLLLVLVETVIVLPFPSVTSRGISNHLSKS